MQRIEVSTGEQKRRRHTSEEKTRFVALAMQPGFASLMKEFLRTDPYKCILCGSRLRFSGAEAGRHATALVE